MDGWLVIDKPLGISSASVINKIKRGIGREHKIGHCGTLDPLASGVLVVGIGEATKLMRFFERVSKRYQFTAAWGEMRDTFDYEGVVVDESDFKPTLLEVKRVIQNFVPGYMQKPPKYSAIKICGRRAYDLARRGHEIEMKERYVQLMDVCIDSYNDHSMTFEIECGSGFYVRSFAVDIGAAVGAMCYVSYLRRTAVGKFSSDVAISLDNFEKVVYNGSWRSKLLPMKAALDDILVQQVDFFEAQQLKKGVSIPCCRVCAEAFVVAMCDDEVVAVCQVAEEKLIPKRVFNVKKERNDVDYC